MMQRTSLCSGLVFICVLDIAFHYCCTYGTQCEHYTGVEYVKEDPSATSLQRHTKSLHDLAR